MNSEQQAVRNEDKLLKELLSAKMVVSSVTWHKDGHSCTYVKLEDYPTMITKIRQLIQAHDHQRDQDVRERLRESIDKKWLADPKYRSLAADKDHSTDYFKALGHDLAIDQFLAAVERVLPRDETDTLATQV